MSKVESFSVELDSAERSSAIEAVSDTKHMRVVERFATSASPAVVWQILADVEHWSEWTPTVVEVRALGNTGLSVGARYYVVQRKLRPAIYEVTECIPNHRFKWVQNFPGGALVADHCLSSRDGTTEVELSFVSKGPLANVVASLFYKMIRRYVATEARCLKNRCEALGQ
jgi:carbon monoxide dehydrogenase subunit G